MGKGKVTGARHVDTLLCRSTHTIHIQDFQGIAPAFRPCLAGNLDTGLDARLKNASRVQVQVARTLFYSVPYDNL